MIAPSEMRRCFDNRTPNAPGNRQREPKAPAGQSERNPKYEDTPCWMAFCHIVPQSGGTSTFGCLFVHHAEIFKNPAKGRQFKCWRILQPPTEDRCLAVMASEPRRYRAKYSRERQEIRRQHPSGRGAGACGCITRGDGNCTWSPILKQSQRFAGERRISAIPYALIPGPMLEATL